MWKEARGRFSKLSPSRRQCSSRSSRGFAVPFMAPQGPRTGTGATLARRRPELSGPASGRTVLPRHRSGAHRQPSRSPPGAESQSHPPRRSRGRFSGSKASGLPASGRDFRVRSGSGGGCAMGKGFHPGNPSSRASGLYFQGQGRPASPPKFCVRSLCLLDGRALPLPVNLGAGDG